MSLKDDILNAVRDSKVGKAFGFKTPEFRKTTPPPKPNPNLGWQPAKSSDTKPPKPPTSGSNAVKPNPNYIPPASVAKPKEECLVNCFCGGRVELEGGTYGYPTVYVRCSKCGGRWSMDTYSPTEAIERWNVKIKFYR